MLSKWSTLCIARGFSYSEREQKCCDCKIPVGGQSGLLMLVKWETGLIFSFITSILSLFCLCHSQFPHLLSSSLSPFPLACRTAGREEWTVKGDDPSLPLFLCRSLTPALSALQSPLSTLITYINMSKKKTAVWICLCMCFRERESVRVCPCVCSAKHKSTTKQSSDCWVVV